MCDYATAISASLGMMSHITAYQADKADWKEIKAAKEQEARNVTQAAHYDLQDLEMSRQDAFDAAMAEIEKIRLNGMDLSGSVATSVAEEIGEGRTASLINRDSEGEQARAVSSVKDNYSRRSNEIDLNMERTTLNANHTLAGIKVPAKPSKSALVLNMLNTGWGHYQTYADRRTERKADLGSGNSKTKASESAKSRTTYYDMVNKGKWK